MTTRERNFLIAGAGAGVLIAAIGIGAVQVERRADTAKPAMVETVQTSAADETANAQEKAPLGVQLTADEMTAAGVQTVAARRATLRSDVDAFGRVEQPEAQLAAISARVGGRIDHLYLQFTGEQVRAGQPVASVYSPDVAAAAEEYRLALENRDRLRASDQADARKEADELVNASRRKLELWGISQKEIDEAKTEGGTPHITIYSNVSGSVVERKVTRGQYVSAGDAMFTVADLSTVWVKADVYESQLPQIRAGQAVEITADALPGARIHGRVEFVEPTANPQTRTVPVHIHVANPNMRLRPGMFVRANFAVNGKRDTVVIPRSSVLHTGTRDVVYIAKADGAFEAREVELGPASEEAYPVFRGVNEGERVVTNGNFLIDSQTRLSEGMTSLFGGSKEFGTVQQKGDGSKSQANQAKIAFAVDPNPPKGATDNAFHVTLTGTDGKPITDAKVVVTLIMPAMPAMNMPEMRSSFELPQMGGMYMGKGNVPMAGPWNVAVAATRNGQTIATYRTRLSAK